ncbi:MAG: bifunctional demethylmenaquinone methyltransferase/2-methoxy-6-polyprenyl-1,4-benzoquinol methylase UbiE [Puia sp.]|nr:bifunctional demethylmenaquinone methyltransferase/2-methoxy-6-polyprenyl-1,4-benzoquinol methylase UbiE [Puia sp.]
MAKYTHDSIVPFKDSGLGKKEQVADMFNKIAFRYDLLNRFLSGGTDLSWRKKAIREIANGGGAPSLPATQPPLRVLDVATGTADMAILMTRMLPGVRITGVDISTGMLEIGRQKLARLQLSDRVELLTGDSEALGFPDNSFDAITVAFGVRNFENLEKGLREMRRVLKPGGRLVILEFSHPKNPVFRQVCNLYMRVITPGIGKMISKNREAYSYLNKSVAAFPEGAAMIAILDGAGYTHTRLKALSLGICSIYTGTK